MAGTVTVACKWPSGLDLAIYKMVETDEDHPGGTRKIKQAVKFGESVKIKGYLKPNKPGVPPAPASEAYYELTHGVNEEFMKTWMEQNRESDLVKNEIIKFGKPEDMKSIIRENEKRRCGMEPLDPHNLPSVVRAISTHNPSEDSRAR